MQKFSILLLVSVKYKNFIKVLKESDFNFFLAGKKCNYSISTNKLQAVSNTIKISIIEFIATNTQYNNFI